MKKSDVSCKKVMDHICDNLGVDMDSPKCIAIKEHLNSCSNCRVYFGSIEKTIDFYKEYNVKLTKSGHDRLIEYLGLNEEEDLDSKS